MDLKIILLNQKGSILKKLIEGIENLEGFI